MKCIALSSLRVLLVLSGSQPWVNPIMVFPFIIWSNAVTLKIPARLNRRLFFLRKDIWKYALQNHFLGVIFFSFNSWLAIWWWLAEYEHLDDCSIKIPNWLSFTSWVYWINQLCCCHLNILLSPTLKVWTFTIIYLILLKSSMLSVF